MTTHPHPSDSTPPTDVQHGSSSRAVRIQRDQVQSALERLITEGNPRIGAQRLVRNAARHGIDLDLVWGILGDPKQNQPAVRQVCMVVPGAGGTGMCFVSSPKQGGVAGSTAQLDAFKAFGSESIQIDEIGASLVAAIEDLPEVAGDRVKIAQMLFEPKNEWFHTICQRASMTCVGTLDYLRMDFGRIRELESAQADWGDGIVVRAIRDLSMETPTSDGSLLARALERSYDRTLDCPELCGMRSMPDVIESHRSTGVFDTSRWWLMLKEGEPVGCCLLTHCPPNESVELVYLGLGPEVQGRGFGKRLLVHALRSLRIKDTVYEVTCAVDRRNSPASNVYLSLGFQRFDARVGYVRPV
ncbi:MAG: GNAT family N-acetyltransferase [Phycisphaerales bacterium]|nr:GNAT family N-acetyltransferase [Phycisphaerales bacterium]